MPSPTYTIEQWARAALTGNPDATTPADAALAIHKAGVINTLIVGYPCIGATPLSNLTEPDLDAFAEWAGYELAARYLGTPAGQALAGTTGGTTTTKVGPVSRQKNAPGITVKGLLMAAMEARNRVGCIRLAIATANAQAPNLATLTGRRRAIGEPRTIQGELLSGCPHEGERFPGGWE